MPILQLLALIAACTVMPRPEPEWLGVPNLTPWATAAVVVAFALLDVLLARRVARRGHEDRASWGREYLAFRHGQGRRHLAGLLVALLGAGWGWWADAALQVERADGKSVLAPFGELALLAPFAALQVCGWLTAYGLEATRARRAGRELPRQALLRFLFGSARGQTVFLGVPLIVLVGQQTLARFYPETLDSAWGRLIPLAVFLVLPAILPLALVPLLGLKSMPPGLDRDRLAALAERCGLRYRDLLIWPTSNSLANAMVIGLVRPLRYVVFTDRLLAEMPPAEVDAVFGHELGHVRHRHALWYVGFVTLSVVLLSAGWAAGLGWLRGAYPEWARAWDGWLPVGQVVALGAYLLVAFGALSRRCEREADIFGCRVASGAGGDDSAPTTATGVDDMIDALRRVDAINGMTRNESSAGGLARVRRTLAHWQHGAPGDRIGFLRELAGDPGRERVERRRIAAVRGALVLALIAGVAAVGWGLGWEALYRGL